MATLTAQEIDQIALAMHASDVMPGAIDSPAGRAMLVALDAYMETNASAINAAIPQPARSGATVGDKSIALAVIVLARAGKIGIIRSIL